MPDVSSAAPADVKQWIVFDVHKNSLVAGVLPATGGSPEVSRLENTERAIRRFIGRTGDPSTLAVAYEAGPCGYEIYRFLSAMGVACDVIAPCADPDQGRGPGQDQPPRRQEAGAALPRR